MAEGRLRVRGSPEEEQSESVADQWEAAANVAVKPLRWLVPGRVVQGAVAIIEGHKGVGKSTFLAALVASITRGRPMVGRKRLTRGCVLWSAGEEDPASVVRPRLAAAKADLAAVHFPAAGDGGRRRRLALPYSLGALRQAVEHYRPVLLILDPLSSHVPPELDLRNDQGTHQVLDPLADLAHDTGCTVVLSRNLVKSRDVDRVHAGLGGAAVGGVARSVLAIDWPDRAQSKRVLRVIACNLVGAAPPLEYRIEDRGGWGVMAGARELTPDQDDANAALLDDAERDVRADARLLLTRLVSAEWVPVGTIIAEANAASISERTLRSAKVDLGIRSRRVGANSPAYWEWGPPK